MPKSTEKRFEGTADGTSSVVSLRDYSSAGGVPYQQYQESGALNDTKTEGYNKAMNEQHYTKTEVDLKLENLEQKFDHNLDKVLFGIEKGFSELQKEIVSIKKDHDWIRGLLIAVAAGVIVVIIQGYSHNTEQPVINNYTQTTTPEVVSE